MKYLNCNVLNASDATSENGIQVDANQLAWASFQAIFGDAAAAGTLKVQASNDICPEGYMAQVFTVTNWTDIPSASVAVVAGASVLISKIDLSYRWIRVVYTSSAAGSTTIHVNMQALSQ